MIGDLEEGRLNGQRKMELEQCINEMSGLLEVREVREMKDVRDVREVREEQSRPLGVKS